MSISLMYEKAESGWSRFLFPCHAFFLVSFIVDLMLRKPRNARTDRLTDWRFFIQIYLVCLNYELVWTILKFVQIIGLMMWPCAMSMWFLYMSQQGLGFYDVILVYNKWGDGYHGYTIDQLNTFVSTGQCI
jgi:sodium/potassium-transporting ATPase subunit alpha